MKTPTPWFRKQTGCWYVELDGKQHNLGKDRDAAFLKAADLTARCGSTCRQLLAKFSLWVAANRAPKTAEWYERHFGPFLEAAGGIDIHEMKPDDVTRWLGRIPGNHNTRSGAIVAVKSAFNWLVRNELIAKSPVAKVQAPGKTPCEDFLSPQRWKAVAKAAAGDPVEDVLTVLRETGARPQEIRAVEAQHVQEDKWLFPLALSKGRKCRRVVRMTAVAKEIVSRLVDENPAGPIFRNSKGRPWTKYSLARAFQRISKLVGFRVAAYHVRHTFATDALVAGVDPVTVGVLMGHRDGAMVSRVYQHLAQREDHLQAALVKASSR